MEPRGLIIGDVVIGLTRFARPLARSRGTAGLWALLVVLGSCGPATPPDTKPLPTPGVVLFEDRFTDESGRWIPNDDQYAFVGYLPGGGLGVQLRRNAHVHAATEAMSLSRDVYVEVEYELTAASKASFGPTCRVSPTFNGTFYSFQVGTDGSLAIVRYGRGVKTLAQAAPSRSSLGAPSTVRIGAYCVGPGPVWLALVANGTLLLQVDDVDSPIVSPGLATFFANGDAGPMARLKAFTVRDAVR